MKRLFSFVLIMLLIILSSTVASASVLLNSVSMYDPENYVGETTVTEGDFTYTVYYDADDNVTDVWLTGYSGSGGHVTIPSTITYKSASVNVQTIGDNVFKDKNLTGVEIPEGITWICSGAFQNNGLMSITLPSSIKGIGYDAFKNNDLTSVNLPSSLQGLSETAFDGNVIKRISTPSGGMLNKQLFYQFFSNVDRGTTTPAWFIDTGFSSPITDDNFGNGTTYYNGGEATVYTITYNIGSGQNHSENPTSYTVIDNNITLQPASKTGYTCENWYSTTDDTYGTTLNTTDMENKTYTANYCPNPYLIKFIAINPSGQTVSASEYGGTGSVTATFDETYPTTIDNSGNDENNWQGNPLIAPSRTGDEFLGYYSQPYAQGTKYYDHTMTPVQDVFNTPNDVSLFAGFRATSNTAIVTFEENGGTTVADMTVTKGNLIAKPTNPTKDGYNFDGWYKDTPLTTPWNFDEDTVSGNITLYAKWTANAPDDPDDPTIVYAPNGGEGNASNTVSTGKVFDLHDGTSFTNSGHIIDGWTIEGTDYMLAESYTMPGKNVTALAIWKKDTDGDGICDEDETASGTDPNSTADKPITATVNINIVGGAGVECKLNSTPIYTTADANGNATFTNVRLATHTLTLSNGSGEIGRYTLNFTDSGSNNTGITNNGAGSSRSGSVSTTVASNFSTLDLVIQQNGSGFWELVNAAFTANTTTTSTVTENTNTTTTATTESTNTNTNTVTQISKSPKTGDNSAWIWAKFLELFNRIRHLGITVQM